MAAEEFGVAPKYRVLSRPLIRVAGLFNRDIRESWEMLYQSDSEYLFDRPSSARPSVSVHVLCRGYPTHRGILQTPER